MKIREYASVDKFQILQLHVEFEEEFSSNSFSKSNNLDERYSYFINQPGKFWVMEDNGVIVGFIGVQINSKERADLVQLRVRKSHRRMGIGTLLVEKVEEYVTNQGIRRIFLHTAEQLVKARNLYEKSGYSFKSAVESSFGFTVILYIKDLKP